MYEVFYKLKAEPFRLSPNHRFCYDHKGYAKARAYMAYAYLRAEGFVMITGRPGTGKTTLIGELIATLADENVVTANLVCTQLHADDLLKTVAYNFGVDSHVVEKGELLEFLRKLLLKWNRQGHRALLIVDEAQDLSPSALEELRLLTNIQVDGNPLLQIFLLGQSELRNSIISPNLEQVHQRIVAASHLEPLEEQETEGYIIHRLERAGWQGDPAISKTVFPLIYKFSEGIPRRINLICSRLFLRGAVEQRHRIGVEDVREVITELQAEFLAVDSLISDYDFTVEDVFEDHAVPEPVAQDSTGSGSSTVQPYSGRPSPVQPASERVVVSQSRSMDVPRPSPIDTIQAEKSAESHKAEKEVALEHRDALTGPFVDSEWPSLREQTLLISFLFDSTEIPPYSYPDLDRIIATMAEYKGSTALIEGHSDNIGSPEYNVELSRKRGDAVAKYLVDKGIASCRLEVQGRGASDRTASDLVNGSLGGRIVQITIRGADPRFSTLDPGASANANG